MITMDSEEQLDVAILGGGLAGSLLGRQLRMALPDAAIAVFEKNAKTSLKVGESTVEIGGNYLTRRLGLSSYIYTEHLPKNGLRFFFDTEEKDGELPALSELGTYHLPYWPAFQTDRARLEKDLHDMLRADGVVVNMSTTVETIELAEGEKRDTGHRIVATNAEGSRTYRARWVVDATGRARTLVKQRGLHVEADDHRVAAVWGRFRNVTDIDTIDAPAWHERARHTSRMLSTNHFCYDGYWIWFIPLGEGLTSVGVVCDRERWKDEWRKEEGFLEFLRSHRAIASLLEEAELVDILSLGQLAYGVKQFFSVDRWALVGEAGAYPDPFYSPGTDVIAVQNDQVTDMIVRDFAGEDIADRVATYEAFMHYRVETIMQLYRNMYPVWGSYELFKIKCLFDCSCYFDLWFDSYLRDLHLDIDWLKGELRKKHVVIEGMQKFNDLFAKAAKELRERGQYYRQNLDHHVLDGCKAFGAKEDLGVDRDPAELNARIEEIFNEALTATLALLPSNGASAPREPLRLEQFVIDGRPLWDPEIGSALKSRRATT